MIKYFKRSSFRKLFLFSFLITLFFVANISKASASNLYWYSTGSQDWTLSTNWWSDSSHSIQASVPTNSDDAILLGSVAPIANLDLWTIPKSINSYGLTSSAKSSGVVFSSASSTGLTITVVGNATFNGNSKNILGVIIGNVIFNNNSSNSSLIFGDAIFNSTSSNTGTIIYNAIFNDNAYNTGIIDGDATYNNPNYNQYLNKGLIKGNAVLAFASSSIATINSGAGWGTVLGTTKGIDGITVTSWIFMGTSRNWGTIQIGTTTFNGQSINYGTTTSAIFNDSSRNYYVVTGDAVFNATSSNNGKVNGNAIFNATSTNILGTVTTATFNNSAQNYGTVTGNAIFNDTSGNGSVTGAPFTGVRGDALFNGDNSINSGVILGIKTRRYSNLPDQLRYTFRNFVTSGPWTIIADGVQFTMKYSTYDSSTTSPTYTTLTPENGGSFVSDVSPAPTGIILYPVLQPYFYVSTPFFPTVYLPGPQISNISATTTPNSAIVTWNTNSSSNSIVNASNLTFGLALTDTSTTTSHLINLTGMASCSTYQYKVASTDISGTTISDIYSFTTTGCTGNAPIIEATSTPDVSITTGANIAFNANNGQSLNVAIPTNFTATSSLATFEVTRIDTPSLLSAVSLPTGVQSANTNTYQLGALTDASTLLSSFSNPLTLTMSYDPSSLGDTDVSTLKIQRYDEGTGWTELSNCSLNTSAHTVTCSTDHFSVFSIFGYKITLPTITTHHYGSRSNTSLALATPTYPLLTSNLPTVNTQLSAAEVAAIKTQLNAKIATLMQQLLKLLTARLNSLLGL
ncbi:MAG: fibronectin type III domain-containing protein [bacterium]